MNYKREILTKEVGLKSLWSRAIGFCLTALAATLVCVGPAAAQVNYTYTGNHFTLFSCGGNSDGVSWTLCSTPGPNANSTYTATDRVTGTLSLLNPLPPNMPITDVRTYDGFHLTLSDGEHTVTDLDAAGGFYAEVATDGTGAINQWRLVLNTGYPLNGGVATINKASSVFDVGTLLGIWPGNQGYIFSSPGTWNSGAPSPAGAVTNLINLLQNPTLQLTSGQINSFTDKLNNVLASIQAGDNKQAINQLQAFINAVEAAQRTRKIGTSTAQTLIDAANAIIAMLS